MLMLKKTSRCVILVIPTILDKLDKPCTIEGIRLSQCQHKLQRPQVDELRAQVVEYEAQECSFSKVDNSLSMAMLFQSSSLANQEPPVDFILV